MGLFSKLFGTRSEREIKKFTDQVDAILAGKANEDIKQRAKNGKFDERLALLGMILDAIFPEPVSASDGSSDHPSFMDDVSAIIGTDVQQWIDNFTSDPLGTLGIQLPSFDIGGFISALFGGSGDDAQTISSGGIRR